MGPTNFPWLSEIVPGGRMPGSGGMGKHEFATAINQKNRCDMNQQFSVCKRRMVLVTMKKLAKIL